MGTTAQAWLALSLLHAHCRLVTARLPTGWSCARHSFRECLASLTACLGQQLRLLQMLQLQQLVGTTTSNRRRADCQPVFTCVMVSSVCVAEFVEHLWPHTKQTERRRRQEVGEWGGWKAEREEQTRGSMPCREKEKETHSACCVAHSLPSLPLAHTVSLCLPYAREVSKIQWRERSKERDEQGERPGRKQQL